MTSVFGNFFFKVLKILKIHAINYREIKSKTNESFDFYIFKSMKLLFAVFNLERKNIELLDNG